VLEYLCITLSVSVLAVAHLRRVRYLNQRLQASLERRLQDRAQERARIARELHDSLLQEYQGVMFRLEAVRRLLPARPDEAANHLDVAIDRGLAAITEGRRAVGELRAHTAAASNLPQALSDLGSEFERLCDSGAAPNYEVLVEGRAVALKPIVRDEVYRVAREAVRNSFRHARAARVEVELVFAERTLTVRVRDDGIGLDPTVFKEGHRNGHWGLPGMQERARGFGGQLQVWSERNAGTEIELRIAGRIAYARQVEERFSCFAAEN
jgi:signal transduction histidine kinase